MNMNDGYAIRCESLLSLQSSPVDEHFRRQKRTVFPPEAIKRLNEYFEVDPSPNMQNAEELAKELEVDPKTIQVWFCNRRQKWKQQQMQMQQQQ